MVLVKKHAKAISFILWKYWHVVWMLGFTLVNTLIPFHLFSKLSFTAVQEKPKCYETIQNMEDTYHSEMFFLTWENYQLFLLGPPSAPWGPSRFRSDDAEMKNESLLSFF